MVEKHLPDGADIHGGGTDLRFPHHENELAQSAGAHPDHPLVRAWAHHGMVNLTGGKMAKALGNILDVERAVNLHGRNAVRMWLLQSHYSQPIEYSEEILEEKRRSYVRLMRFYRETHRSRSSSKFSDELADELHARFDEAMRDDFNTPEAIAALFDVTARAGREIYARPETAHELTSLRDAVEKVMSDVLGFDLAEESTSSVGGLLIRHEEQPTEKVLQRAADRERGRQRKDWAYADRLREELEAEGWSVEDTPEGPILNRR
jgi:cysteinyl-tRNA synthetase